VTTHELFPYFRFKDTAAAIRFYCEAFGATERFRLTEPSGRIGHAELELGPTAVLMLSDEFPEYGITVPASAESLGPSIHLHVDDADAFAARAVAAGATLVTPPTEHFYGERSCRLIDPFGYVWLVGHSIETLTPEEMQRRYTALFVSPA
jgi:uncharacterized glyoxalase superfamily protein PhnB